MQLSDFNRLLAEGEGLHVEFKGTQHSAYPDPGTIAKSFVAFANTAGGLLIIGVNDKTREIEGVSNVDRMQLHIVNAARNNCSPAIVPQLGHLVMPDGKKRIVWARIAAPTAADSFHMSEFRIYIRVGNSNYPIASPDELRRWRGERERQFQKTGRPPSKEAWRTLPQRQGRFRGRQPELEKLHHWLEDPAVVLVAIEGISGIGKTTLASQFAEEIKKHGYHSMWLECHTEMSYDILVSHLAGFARSHGDELIADRLEDPTGHLEDQLNRVVALLADKRYALFFDDYHLVVDPIIRRFIEKIKERGKRVKVFLTVRQRPVREVRAIGAAELHIQTGIDARATSGFLADCGVEVSAAVAKKIWKITGQGHPVALRIFATRAKSLPIHLLMSSLPVFSDDIKDEWLNPLLNELTPEQRELLTNLSIFDRQIPFAALKSLYPTMQFETTMVALVDRFMIDYSQEDSLRIHPLIREHCQCLLLDKASQHQRAAEFYLRDAGETSDSESFSEEQIEKLSAAWHHFGEAGNTERVADVLERLRRPLLNRGLFGQLMQFLERTPPTNARQQARFALDRARIIAAWGDTSEAVRITQAFLDASDKLTVREAVLVLIAIYLGAREMDRAKELLIRSREMFDGDNVPFLSKMRFLSRSVETHLLCGEAAKAYEWAAQIREVCEREKDTIGGAVALRQMAASLQAQEQFDTALMLSTLSQDLLEEKREMRQAAVSKMQTASILAQMNRKKEALVLFESTLQTLLPTGDRTQITKCRQQIRELQNKRSIKPQSTTEKQRTRKPS